GRDRTDGATTAQGSNRRPEPARGGSAHAGWRERSAARRSRRQRMSTRERSRRSPPGFGAAVATRPARGRRSATRALPRRLRARLRRCDHLPLRRMRKRRRTGGGASSAKPDAYRAHEYRIRGLMIAYEMSTTRLTSTKTVARKRIPAWRTG